MSLLLLFAGAGGAVSYTITADAGSYSVTGTAATLKYGYVLAAGAGSYAITGTAVTLVKGYPLAAAAGSYAITGTDAALEYGRLLAATDGSYSVTGVAASLEYGHVLIEESGSYAVTGSDASLIYTPAGAAYTLAVEAGTYTITGTVAGLIYTPVVIAPSSGGGGGGTAKRRRGLRVPIEVVKPEKWQPRRQWHFSLVPEAGKYKIAGSPAYLTRLLVLNAGTGSYSLTGTPVLLVRKRSTSRQKAAIHAAVMAGQRGIPFDEARLIGEEAIGNFIKRRNDRIIRLS